MQTLKNIQRLRLRLSAIGLALVGLGCLLYCLFSSDFAELNVRLPFVDFPVFVGEILLFICLSLATVGWHRQRFKVSAWSIAAFLYCIFVLLKALWGYFYWGPLALRHAALYCYPVFAFFTFIFYQKCFFTHRLRIILIFLLMAIAAKPAAYLYSRVSCLLLAAALIQSLQNRKLKTALFALLFILAPYTYFFKTSRSMLMSVLAVFTYILLNIFFFVSAKKAHKIIVLLLTIVLAAAAIPKFSSRNAIISLTNIDEIRSRYVYYKQRIETRRSEQATDALEKGYGAATAKKVSLYNKNKKTQVALDLVVPAVQERKEIPLPTKYNNILFRAFIWEDMINALKDERPLFGFSFGKPLRSANLDTLGWSTSIVARDGWITAHNSYIDMLYRCGLMGVLIIAALLFMLGRLALKALRLRSLIAVFINASLVSWLVLAFSLVILELPYNAIPFWSLCGLSYAYIYKKECDENTGDT